MNTSISWPDLFRHVDRSGDLDRLEKLHSEIGELARTLDGKRLELLELQLDIRTRLTGAMRVASIFEVTVPDEAAQTLARLKPEPTNRPSGRYLWRPENRVAFRAGISRAMWRLSANSGGSAGTIGVLTSREFRQLLGKKAWARLQAGEELTLKLPNGLELTVVRAKRLELRD